MWFRVTFNQVYLYIPKIHNYSKQKILSRYPILRLEHPQERFSWIFKAEVKNSCNNKGVIQYNSRVDIFSRASGIDCNTLDLFLTTDPKCYSIIISIPMRLSDHALILVSAAIYVQPIYQQVKIHYQTDKFITADWDDLRYSYLLLLTFQYDFLLIPQLFGEKTNFKPHQRYWKVYIEFHHVHWETLVDKN